MGTVKGILNSVQLMWELIFYGFTHCATFRQGQSFLYTYHVLSTITYYRSILFHLYISLLGSMTVLYMWMRKLLLEGTGSGQS